MEERARELIAEHLGTSAACIVHEASFVELGADSLDLVSLTMALEEAFDVHIPDERAEACATVSDVLLLIAERRAIRSAALPPSPEFADV